MNKKANGKIYNNSTERFECEHVVVRLVFLNISVVFLFESLHFVFYLSFDLKWEIKRVLIFNVFSFTFSISTQILFDLIKKNRERERVVFCQHSANFFLQTFFQSKKHNFPCKYLVVRFVSLFKFNKTLYI